MAKDNKNDVPLPPTIEERVEALEAQVAALKESGQAVGMDCTLVPSLIARLEARYGESAKHGLLMDLRGIRDGETDNTDNTADGGGKE